MIVEAFSGVLFASLISAIMFVKVARVQNVAQVEFCEPICVRFGAAVAIEIANDEAQRGADDDSQSADEPDCCPCPLLEFRVANRMNNIVGGEIIDAMIKVVAVVSEEQGLSFPTRRASKGVPEPLDVSSDEVDPQLKLTYVGALEDDTFYEDQTGHLEPATAFSKVECQTHQHPFFKRVFVVRHKLDQTSPLLKVPIRGMINDNNGNWPQDLKTAHDVRQCLQFDHLLVSLRGTSNAAAKTVHARKVYDHDDLIVGYQFSPMVYRDSSGALQIDMNLINDVAEQVGGGGEDMSAIDSRRN